MATKRWRGDAQAVAQVNTVTPASVGIGNIFTLTINGKTVTFTATAGTVANVTAGLTTAVNNSTVPEFREITATDNTTTLSLTARTAGVPFVQTSSASGGSATLTTAATTANSGPNKWEVAANWSPSGVPAGTLIAPVQSAAAAASGGSLSDSTTYYWVVVATNANGETVVSNERSLAISNPNNTATISWAQVAGATGYKIFRSTSAGSYGATSLVTTISSGTTLTYNDTGAALSSGTPLGVSTATGDDVVIENSTVSILYDLDQSDITLLSFTAPASFTGKIGSPVWNPAGYWEYRDTTLTFASAGSTVSIGGGDGAGSGRIRLNIGSAAATVTVQGTGTPAEPTLPALQLTGSNASNVLNVYQGSVGLAVETSTTAQYATIRVGSESSPANDVTLTCGAGCTLATIQQAGGNVTVSSAVTTWTKTADSTSRVLGTATITTLTQDGAGRHYQESSGTITTATFRGTGAEFDKSRDLRAVTITNCTFTGGGFVRDPNKTITFTNPMTTDQVSLAKHVLSQAPFSLQRT